MVSAGSGNTQNLRGAQSGEPPATLGWEGFLEGPLQLGLKGDRERASREEVHPRLVKIFVLGDSGQWTLIAAGISWALSLCQALV